MSLKSCSDMTEAIPLEPSLGLYLKPISRIKINVQLPRLNAPGQSISSWHVMEKLKETVRPDTFLYLKALKIASNVIKLEGELETKTSCERALARLRATGSLNVSGFSERLQIRAAHASCNGPTRHEWEAFFRDAKGGNEMKPGERPDTLHLEEIPVRWFSESSKGAKPSEKLLQKAFGTFGKIRRLEIQRNVVLQDNTFGKTSSLQNDMVFEAYIQYEEYVEFSIAMDSLRGKKLLYKEPDGKVYSADIKVDFDRTNYLSEKCIKLREAETKKLHPTLSPDTKAHKDDTDKNSKLPIVIEKDAAMAKEAQTEKKTDQDLLKKDKTDQLQLEEKEKAQNEAKLLLSELFHRVEKHKRKMDTELEKSSSKCIPQESHKETKELKKLTKKRKLETEMCVDQRRDKNTQSFQEGKKMDKPFFSKSISDMQSKELQRNTQVKGCSEKRPNKDHERDSLNFQNSVKKQKPSQELSKEYKKKTQPFYEVRKEKQLHKDNETFTRKQMKKVTNLHTNERSKEKDRSMYVREKEKNAALHKEGIKTKEKESTDHCKIKEKNAVLHKEDIKTKEKEFTLHCKIKERDLNSHNEEKKESVTKLLDEERKNREKLILQERILKEKLLRNLKAREEEKLRNREKLRKELAGRKVLKSVLVDTNHSLHKKS